MHCCVSCKCCIKLSSKTNLLYYSIFCGRTKFRYNGRSLTLRSNDISTNICINNICSENISRNEVCFHGDDVCLHGDVNNFLVIFVVYFYAIISRQRKQNASFFNLPDINSQVVIIGQRNLPIFAIFDFPFVALVISKHPFVLQGKKGVSVSDHR